MPQLIAIHFRPPLAFARLGGSPRPLDNFEWRDDPTIHGAAHTVIEPTTTLELRADGSVLPFRPSLLIFSDEGELRPVAPFFELWATVAWSAEDEEVTKDHRVAGSTEDVALTGTLLGRVGGTLGGVEYSVQVANRKAARRTGDEANAFEAQLQVKGNDFHRRELLGSTIPKPQQVPLVTPDRPIPLGAFQVAQPVARTHSSIDLDVLRVRFTPARGQVYGPPDAIEAADASTGRVYPIVPAGNRILNPEASWLRYDASYLTFANPEPSDTYDGSDQDASVSWGVVDDTCDGVIRVSVVAQARRYEAAARVSSGPPDFAPDRRPFLSLADDLTDRDIEPLSEQQLKDGMAVTEEAIADLFARVFETASLINLDILRTRGLNDNKNFILADATKRVGHLPLTDEGSLTEKDIPYADAKVKALVPGASTRDLPFTDLAPLAHETLAELDGLLSFLRAMPERVQRMLRPAYGVFEELKDSVKNTDAPSEGFRDARLDRDRAHDMRMPPYMRDELGNSLSLTRKQYVEILRYLKVLAGAASGAESAGAQRTAATAQPGSAAHETPLRQRVNQTLARRRTIRHGGG